MEKEKGKEPAISGNYGGKSDGGGNEFEYGYVTNESYEALSDIFQNDARVIGVSSLRNSYWHKDGRGVLFLLKHYGSVILIRHKTGECRYELFARVFGELTFEELGEKFDMKPKQAEMAFYYILRKLRKELEVSGKDEF